MSKIAQGIYKRGKTFWYRYQKDGKRLAVSLKTDDEQTALQRAALAKTDAPMPKAKATGETFKEQVERSTDYSV